MKKQYIAVVAFIAAVVVGWLLPSNAGAVSRIAGVRTDGTLISDFNLDIADVSDPLNTLGRSSVTWSGVNPPVPAPGWKIADRCLVIRSTITDLNKQLDIYTDNTEADADPRFIGPATVNPVGLLISTGTPPRTTRFPGLPMGWSIKSSTKVVELPDNRRGIGASDPDSGPETPGGYNNRFQWFFFLDEAYNFNPASPYVGLMNVLGLHYAQGDGEFGDYVPGAPSFVYIEAAFRSAAAQTPYQTSKLTVEMRTI